MVIYCEVFNMTLKMYPSIYFVLTIELLFNLTYSKLPTEAALHLKSLNV